ncbi:type II toxin-antitoxin system HipA family toxin [Frankia sp. AgB1.9]|uniref:type II toxin-antitoxin system HipA family toxin n=1 Tax=unclassified Frankia TaxID=2632575 RepID=UPI001932B4FA|nr:MULTISPECIES: type II toxin-antitoxin system HipA family toxin [unclassified Frankia]MBL7487300.1 type II toxin-antitoxin system HipA family toxin [Frankia sp. AgW1.1]MBL7546307.1 type II toxin-antitoxin system HipA family toxin [Frankia sp. AgB1.9]MBL7618648.1 type II toxin-antitoxin system HipA family toxin [Frankia sp. AgB1.8]
MAARSLLVVLYGVPVGRVAQRHAAAEPEFTYEPAYLAARPSSPLGVRMPLSATTYRGKSVRAFVEGVLPEDPRTRQRWGATLGVEPDDTLALLAHMGWDCPGAVQFCEPDALDEMLSRAHETRPVSDRDIADRLSALRTGDAASWSLPDEHWSLPGQQSKFALAKLPTGWHEAHGSAATTHIIKPGIGRLHHQSLVEHATMRAASALGLDVARTEFTRFGDGEPAIVIERYDRVILDDGRVLRLHQEDFCSASGRLPAKKYEAHGGPGLTDLARIVEQNSRGQAAAALAAIGDFAAINYVAGAPDGHSKNVSLLLLPNEIKVAPLYDLATSLPYDTYPGLREIAIGIGGRRKFGQVLGRHWDRAAAVLGIPAEQYRTTVRELARRFPDAFSDALTLVGTPDAEEVRKRSIDRIARHTSQLAERLHDPREP